MRRLAFAALLGLVLVGCGGAEAPRETGRQRLCDDGGSGGVLIDGVCV